MTDKTLNPKLFEVAKLILRLVAAGFSSAFVFVLGFFGSVVVTYSFLNCPLPSMDIPNQPQPSLLCRNSLLGDSLFYATLLLCLMTFIMVFKVLGRSIK